MRQENSLEEKVLKTIQKSNLIEEGDKIVLGVSGGPDSMCMLNALINIYRNCQKGPSLVAKNCQKGPSPMAIKRREKVNEQKIFNSFFANFYNNYHIFGSI